jgi:hypothetical protein
LKGNKMAESKFTSGPWVATANQTFDNAWDIKANGVFLGSAVAAKAKANAELWADAPRLLEVLRTLHDFALPLRDRGLAAESEQAFADARALLEKHGG